MILQKGLDQTWLSTVKESGAQFGYGNYADMITKSSDGSYTVADDTARKSIMKLRDDPAVASTMAAAFTQSNSFQLTGMIGRRPSDSATVSTSAARACCWPPTTRGFQ